MKTKNMIFVFMYVVYFLMAIKGFIYSNDQMLPTEFSSDSFGQSFLRVFAYGAVETELTVFSLLPKKLIAETDSFKTIEINTHLSLMDIARMYPKTNPQPGYCAPGFETLNYYFNARIMGLLNNIDEVRKPLGHRKLIVPVFYQKKGRALIPLRRT